MSGTLTMEIYLDANATTPVLPQARAAAMEAMAGDFGNPSSVHGTGLKARALMDAARACARRVIGASTGQLLFLSGATEGIQTAVLSALTEWRRRRDRGEAIPQLLLYGATEHKAVPEALRHWNDLLRLDLRVVAIPVGRDGRHDLEWLRAHAARAALVCTMAANNETGVVSDLDGLQRALAGSPALWMVDSVQALGKLPLRLDQRPIDYAPFSGHKLYAPKGIGLLYVRDGAPFTPLLAGGGQEGALRSGTENMPGIAALGAVLGLLERGEVFQPAATLERYRTLLTQALRDAFPGIVFNADAAIALPTTINFSVPGVSAKVLLDLFDAASVRVSGGSACGAAKAQPSYVLEAMGLEAWRSASAVRLSFGPATEPGLVDEACERIRSCGASLRASCMTTALGDGSLPVERIRRHVVDGAVCYLVADAASRRCVVIDPLPELTQSLAQWVRCRGFELVAVLDTHSHGDHASSAAALWDALRAPHVVPAAHVVPAPPVIPAKAGIQEMPAQGTPSHDALGWPLGTDTLHLGPLRLTRAALPGHTADSTAYLLGDDTGLQAVFVGDTILPGALGRSDFPVSEPLRFVDSLRTLARLAHPDTLLLPGHDYEDAYACTLATEIVRQPLLEGALSGTLDAEAFARAKSALERDIPPTQYQTMACGAPVAACCRTEAVELAAGDLHEHAVSGRKLLLVDVREAFEHRLGVSPMLDGDVASESVPLSSFVNALPRWMQLDEDSELVLFCRSGNRSAQAARALRRLGFRNAWSLAGGVALWPGEGTRTSSRHDIA